MSSDYKPDELIDGEIRETVIRRVAEGGWLEEKVNSTHADHLVAWVPLEVLGTLRTTSVLERPKGEEQPTWVRADGNIKIGPGDIWGGRRVAIFVLEDEKGDDVVVRG